MHMQHIVDSLRPAGLVCLGGFVPRPDDGVPAGSGLADGGCLLLVGNAGPAMWDCFRAATGAVGASLDDWTRAAIDPLAVTLAAAAFYPFAGPPYLPFQRWAERSGAAFASPLGLAIHPQFGLWHAYRAALLFDKAVDGIVPAVASSPCESCAERPCLRACPVGAFTADGYDVPVCRGHLEREEGAACREGGCLARHACPVGRAYTYAPEQATFHMAAFRGLPDG